MQRCRDIEGTLSRIKAALEADEMGFLHPKFIKPQVLLDKARTVQSSDELGLRHAIQSLKVVWLDQLAAAWCASLCFPYHSLEFQFEAGPMRLQPNTEADTHLFSSELGRQQVSLPVVASAAIDRRETLPAYAVAATRPDRNGWNASKIGCRTTRVDDAD